MIEYRGYRIQIDTHEQTFGSHIGTWNASFKVWKAPGVKPLFAAAYDSNEPAATTSEIAAGRATEGAKRWIDENIAAAEQE